jgi:hypothetical protein
MTDSNIQPVSVNSSSIVSTSNANQTSLVVTTDEEYIVSLRAPKRIMKWAITQTIGNHLMTCNKPSINVYGIPITTFQADERKFKPQVELYFTEDKNRGYKALGLNRLEGEIKFRVMGKESETITQNDIRILQSNIQNTFMTNNGYVWRKGKGLYTYLDKSKGYQFQLFCINSAEAKRIIGDVMGVQGHAPEWERFVVHQHEEADIAFPSAPQTQIILSKTVNSRVRRRQADVRFRYATLHIDGLPVPIVLAGRPGKQAHILT